MDRGTHRITNLRYYNGMALDELAEQKLTQVVTQRNGRRNGKRKAKRKVRKKRSSIFRILCRSSDYATLGFWIIVYKIPATKKKQEKKPDEQPYGILFYCLPYLKSMRLSAVLPMRQSYLDARSTKSAPHASWCPWRERRPRADAWKGRPRHLAKSSILYLAVAPPFERI